MSRALSKSLPRHLRYPLTLSLSAQSVARQEHGIRVRWLDFLSIVLRSLEIISHKIQHMHDAGDKTAFELVRTFMF